MGTNQNTRKRYYLVRTQNGSFQSTSFGGCTSLKEVWLRSGTWYIAYEPSRSYITGSFEVTSYEDAASFLKDTYCEKYIFAKDK
jgi:hypothetical protein